MVIQIPKSVLNKYSPIWILNHCKKDSKMVETENIEMHQNFEMNEGTQFGPLSQQRKVCIISHTKQASLALLESDVLFHFQL